MGNEEFLIASYFLVGVICLCLGLTAYFVLRRSFDQIVGRLQRKQWQGIIKKAFPLSTVLIALAGFLSVSYYGCEGRAYKDIVADRTHVITVNEHQISAALSSIVVGVFVWAVLILINLLAIRREQTKLNGSSQPEDSALNR
jgi:hypothetical protein